MLGEYPRTRVFMQNMADMSIMEYDMSIMIEISERSKPSVGSLILDKLIEFI